MIAISKVHKFIVSCVCRKIREKGYRIVALNGDYSQIEKIHLKLPPPIKRHRPDVVGVKTGNLEFCIGEAKTSSDLKTKRTREQLADFANINKCELVVGVPMSDKYLLRKLLQDLGLENNKNISCLYVPEVLFPHEKI